MSYMFKSFSPNTSGLFDTVEELMQFVSKHNIQRFNVKWSESGYEEWDGSSK